MKSSEVFAIIKLPPICFLISIHFQIDKIFTEIAGILISQPDLILRFVTFSFEDTNVFEAEYKTLLRNILTSL